jgi:octopine/nopaline transport system substrate-binding protein
MMKKIFLFIAISAIIFYFLKKTTQNITKKEITVGMMNGYPPYMDISANGVPEGFDVSITTALAKELGTTITIKDLGNLSTLFLALENETIDAVMSGLDITKERAKNYEIVYYYGEKNDRAYIVTLKNAISKENFDQHRWKIAIEPGSSNEFVLQKKENVLLIPLTNYTDMMVHLKNKKIDGFLLDVSQIQRFRELNDDSISFIEITVPEESMTNGLGITFKKGNGKTKEKIQTAVTKLIENGTIAELARTWELQK